MPLVDSGCDVILSNERKEKRKKRKDFIVAESFKSHLFSLLFFLSYEKYTTLWVG